MCDDTDEAILRALKEGDKMQLDSDELDIAARTIWGESRSESTEGKIAVAQVIYNRATHPKWWGTSLGTVCKKPWQFSCWNEGDPNKIKMERLQKDDPVYLECLGIISGVLVGAYLDETEGANHYHTKGLNPRWRDDRKKTAEIGNHVFYRL